MAIKDIEWAYSVELPAPQKAVLVALAHCRNGKTGECFPSQQELGRMTGLADRTVRASLKVLARPGGPVARKKTVKGRYRSNDRYEFNYEYRQEVPEVAAPPAAGTTDQRQDRPKAAAPQAKSGGTTFRAVELTGIEQEKNRKVAAQRGTRIPDDFTVTPAMVAWAREHTPLVDGPSSTEKFIDHWTAATGRNATKRDWIATWRNWLRTDQERAKRLTAPKPWEKSVGRPMTLAEERAQYAQKVS